MLSQYSFTPAIVCWSVQTILLRHADSATDAKREKLQINRKRAKLEKNLGSIADLTRLPAALFIIDVLKEHIAVREAHRLSIPIFAMVDTNSDPNNIDFPIPANDDASNSISLILDNAISSINEGLEERRMDKEKDATQQNEKAGKKKNEANALVEGENENVIVEAVENTEITDEKPKKTPIKKELRKRSPIKKSVEYKKEE